MKWLEIIEIRTANQRTKELEWSLEELISSVKREPNSPKIRVFSSFSVKGDISIHLMHNQKEPNVNGSLLGMRISNVLRAFGMVNHQIWCEIMNNKNTKQLV